MIKRLETWVLGLVAGTLLISGCSQLTARKVDIDRQAQALLVRLEVVESQLGSQTATLQRIEATLSTLAENSYLDARFTETLAQVLAETREYARGSACLSWFILYTTGLAPEESFEYFVHRPLTDCEVKQQEAR